MIVSDISSYVESGSNQIISGKDLVFRKSIIVFKEINSRIFIGNNVDIADSRIDCAKNSEIHIGDGARIRGVISVGSYSSVKIGRNLTVTHDLKIRAVESTEVNIGDDCIFASNVCIRTNDGHPIYSTKTKERINKSKSIEISKHVWLGDEALILKGVKVGAGSIVAPRSVVTSNVDECCIVAGIPAKVVKSQVTWERTTNDHTPEFYEDN